MVNPDLELVPPLPQAGEAYVALWPFRSLRDKTLFRLDGQSAFIQDSKIRVLHVAVRPEVFPEEVHRDGIVQAGVVHVLADHVPSGTMLAPGVVGRPDDGRVGGLDTPGHRVRAPVARCFMRPGFESCIVDADLVVVAPGVPPIEVVPIRQGQESVVHATHLDGLRVDVSVAHGVLESLILVETVAEGSDGLAILLRHFLCPGMIAFVPGDSWVDWVSWRIWWRGCEAGQHQRNHKANGTQKHVGYLSRILFVWSRLVKWFEGGTCKIGAGLLLVRGTFKGKGRREAGLVWGFVYQYRLLEQDSEELI